MEGRGRGMGEWKGRRTERREWEGKERGGE